MPRFSIRPRLGRSLLSGLNTLFFTLVWLPVSAQAATYYWTAGAAAGGTGSSTSWTALSNWREATTGANPTSALGANDDVVFATTATVAGHNYSPSVSPGLAASQSIKSIRFQSGTTWQITGANYILTLASGTITADAGALGQINPALAGTSGLTKLGGGTFSQFKTGSYTGATTVSAGILRYGGPSNLGYPTMGSFGAPTTSSLVVNSGATLDLDGRSGTVAGLSGSGLITNGGTLTVALSSGTSTFSGVLSGAATSLAVAGSAGTILTLTGDNTYGGKTAIQKGTLSVSSLGDVGTPSSNLGAPASAANAVVELGAAGAATLQYSGPTTTTSRGFRLAANSNGNIESSGSGPLTLAGTLDSNTGATGGAYPYLYLGGTMGGRVTGNAVDGTGPLRLGKKDDCTWTLTGTNTFTGRLTITGGTLQVGEGGTTGSLATILVLVEDGGILTYNHSDEVVLAAAIQDGGSLVQAGSGTLILTGNASAGGNTYTGSTNISAGTLQVGNGSSSGSVGTGPITNNGALAVNMTGALTLGMNISGTGTLTKANTNTLTLTGTNTYSGLTTISAGILQVGSNGTTGTLGTGDVLNNAALTLSRSTALNYGGVISGGGTLSKVGGGTVTLAGQNTFTGATTVSGGVLSLGEGGALSGSAVTVTGAGSALTGSGSVKSLAGVSVTANLQPGLNGVGRMSVPGTTGTSVTLNACTLKSTLVGAETGNYGEVFVAGGNVVLATGTKTLVLALGSGYGAGRNAKFALLHTADGSSGTLSVTGNFNIANGGSVTVGGRLFKFYYGPNEPKAAFDADGARNDIVLVAQDGNAPTLTLTPANGSVTFTESAGAASPSDAITLLAGVSLTDADGDSITGATVALTDGFEAGKDLLGYVPTNGISGTYNSTTGVLTLSGTKSAAEYQTALRAVTYRNTSENPSEIPRTVTITVTDNGTATAPATSPNTALITRALNVVATNDAPLAQSQSVTVAGGPQAITLSATDAEGDAITGYRIVTSPQHGTLSGTGATRTYTPAQGYTGSDSFTFAASDAGGEGAPATVTLDVYSSNATPTATNQSLTTPEDTAKSITLTGQDADGDLLTFQVTSQPQHGTLSTLNGGALIYTPSLNYNGSDSFQFTASDGSATSTAGTISLTVTAVNDAPTATGQTLTTAEDTAKSLTLSGVDVDGDTLTYQVASQPQHGTLSTLDGATLTYTPAPNYNGTDAFTFTASDGTATSTVATVSIMVTPVNDAPVAGTDSLTTAEDTPLTIAPADLLANDSDPDGATETAALTVQIEREPAHGTLERLPNSSFRYVPAPNWNGSDSFTYKAKDASGTPSNAATVTIVVSAVNDAPTAQEQGVSLEQDTTYSGTVSGSDVDGDALTFQVVSQPTHGTLVLQNSGAFTYAPHAGYSGTDSFTFKANDGQADSAAAEVSLTVTAPSANLSPDELDASILKFDFYNFKVFPAKGVGIVNSNAQGQTARWDVYSGETVYYEVSIDKQIGEPETVVVTAPATPEGWTVNYRDALTWDPISAILTSQGWRPTLTSGESRKIFIEVTPPTGGMPPAMLETLIKVSSLARPEITDAVKTVTALHSALQTDASIQRWQEGDDPINGGSEIRWGESILNTTGEDQTLALATAPGQINTALVRVENKSGSAGTFNIKQATPNSGWQVKLWQTPPGGQAAQDIFEQCTGVAGWTSPTVAAGDSVVLKLEVTASTSAFTPCQLVFTTQGVQTDVVKATYVVQQVLKMQTRQVGEAWHDVTSSLALTQRQMVGFRAIPQFDIGESGPQDDWPDDPAKPLWTAQGQTHLGPEIWVRFWDATPGETVSVECNNSKQATVQVALPAETEVWDDDPNF